jgi:hypothetical protein
MISLKLVVCCLICLRIDRPVEVDEAGAVTVRKEAGAVTRKAPSETMPIPTAGDVHLLKMTQDILTGIGAASSIALSCMFVSYRSLFVADSQGRTSAIQLSWTDTGGQVQFASIVTLSLRKYV